jgi:hypothetical protein
VTTHTSYETAKQKQKQGRGRKKENEKGKRKGLLGTKMLCCIVIKGAKGREPQQ